MFLEGVGFVHADTRVENEESRDSTSEKGQTPDPRETVLTKNEKEDDHDDRSSKVSNALGTEHRRHHEASSVSSLAGHSHGLVHSRGSGVCLLDNDGHGVCGVGLIGGGRQNVKRFRRRSVGII